MEGEESLLDSLFDAENVEDMEDVDMVDVEEGELAGNNPQVELGQSSNMDGDAAAQESQSKNKKRRNKKKKNKKKKGGSGSDVTDINRYFLYIALSQVSIIVCKIVYITFNFIMLYYHLSARSI